MSLETWQAVSDVHAIILEGSGPGDVIGFVESRLELEENRNLLPPLRRFGKRAHDTCVSRGAIQSHLDGENVVVRRRGQQELLHREVKRIEGMVDHHILLLQYIEDASRGVLELGGCCGDEWRITQLSDLERRERHQVAQVQQRTGLHQFWICERAHFFRLILTQLLHEQLSKRLRHAAFHFDAHDLREATLEDLLLDKREKIVVVFGVR